MTELNYEIDNRDSSTTWLQIYDKDKHLGYIGLSLKDMFGLIENIIENLEE